MSITGTEEGEQVRSGYAVADINAGLMATIGILMAVESRHKTGVGQHVDIAMFDAMISAMSSNYMAYLGSDVVPRPLGTAFPTLVPYRVFQASDRVFSIAVGSEKLWAALCDAIEHPELKSHSHYATNASRIHHRQEVEGQLQQIFRVRTADEWVARLRVAGVPCSVVLNFEEVSHHPQSAFRHMFPTIEHPSAGVHRVTGSPIKLSDMEEEGRMPAPELGEHTSRALADILKLDSAKIHELEANGIIRTSASQRNVDSAPR